MGTKANEFFDRVSGPNVGERVSLGEVSTPCTDACDHGRKRWPHDTHWETATIETLHTYGCWKTDKEGNFLVPEYCSGSDYSGTLVEVSNLKAFRETFAKGEYLWWCEVSGGHGTFALVVDMESIPDGEDAESPDEVRDQVAKWLNALQSYPCADDDLHSHLEMDAQEEAWNDYGRRDFIRAIERRFEVDIDDLPEDSRALIDLFFAVGDRIGEYWINEQGDSMYIDSDKIAAALTRAEVDQLLTETLSHVDAIKSLLVARHRIESLKDAVKKVHGQLSDPSLGTATHDLAALLDALGIDSMEWERCKARRTLPDGKSIFV